MHARWCCWCIGQQAQVASALQPDPGGRAIALVAWPTSLPPPAAKAATCSQSRKGGSAQLEELAAAPHLTPRHPTPRHPTTTSSHLWQATPLQLVGLRTADGTTPPTLSRVLVVP
jgi:hypothetical protein